MRICALTAACISTANVAISCAHLHLRLHAFYAHTAETADTADTADVIANSFVHVCLYVCLCVCVYYVVLYICRSFIL